MHFKIVVKYTENQPVPSQIHQIFPNSLVPLTFASKILYEFYTALNNKLNPLFLLGFNPEISLLPTRLKL
jgi:hypothetical protein